MKHRILALPAFAAILLLTTACGSRDDNKNGMHDDLPAATDRRDDRDAGRDRDKKDKGVVDDAKGLVSDVVDDGKDLVSDAVRGGKDIVDDAADGARDMLGGSDGDDDGRYRTDEDGRIASDDSAGR